MLVLVLVLVLCVGVVVAVLVVIAVVVAVDVAVVDVAVVVVLSPRRVFLLLTALNILLRASDEAALRGWHHWPVNRNWQRHCDIII